MKLLRLSFHDHAQGWGFDDLQFFPDVTLLVGASGVGKTRILNSIRKLREIAQDHTTLAIGLSWSLDFIDDQGQKFTWEVKFSPRINDSVSASEWNITTEESMNDHLNRVSQLIRPDSLTESLKTDQTTIFSRDLESFQVNGKPLDAKLSSLKSGFALLGEEPLLKSAKTAINRILISDFVLEDNLGIRSQTFGISPNLLKELNNIDLIREIEMPTLLKLVIASQTAKPVFDQIAEAFKSIFPTIESVQFTGFLSEQVDLNHAFLFKEAGVDQPFFLYSLSSGMKRTLFHLARLALWPDGTVILIDEFENSLGTNCIDVVADALLKVGNRLQFVISSHHPYIINSIPVDHWKIVARDKGQVQFFSAEELKIGRSKHKAFTELNNTDVFRYGQIPT